MALSVYTQVYAARWDPPKCSKGAGRSAEMVGLCSQTKEWDDFYLYLNSPVLRS